MDLVHMATCSIHWAIMWSTESTKIGQNQDNYFGGFGGSKDSSKTCRCLNLLGKLGGREVKMSALVSRRLWVRIPPKSHSLRCRAKLNQLDYSGWNKSYG